MSLFRNSEFSEYLTADSTTGKRESGGVDSAESRLRPSRREVMTATLAALTAAGLGCEDRSAEPVGSTSQRRSDVPLRVAYCGGQSAVEAIVRGWGGVDPLPLEVRKIETQRENARFLDQLSKAARDSDVLICPAMAIATLYAEGAITPLPDSEIELAEADAGGFLAALRNGVARFAGEYVAAPLGSLQPAWITREPAEGLADWQQYHRWVESIEGRAAEPLTQGWAGTMFLWRCAASLDSGWLFERSDLKPQVDSEPYTQTLRQMCETASLYEGPRLAPEQIWSELKSGSLEGGLAFPIGDADDEIDLNISDPPGRGVTRLLPDPFAPAALLSSQSRQTAASKRFIRWLSGGEGSEPVRREVDGMTVTRLRPLTAAGGAVMRQGSYSLWLQNRLQSPVTLPPLQLLAADEYYRVLDQQVSRCLEGDLEPEAALGQVAEAWRAIADRVGISKQQRAWRQAQGMIA